MTAALTSSQTAQCCRLAAGWRTETHLCHRCLGWNAATRKNPKAASVTLEAAPDTWNWLSERVALTCSTRTEWWTIPFFCSDITKPFMLLNPMSLSRKSACAHADHVRCREWRGEHVHVPIASIPYLPHKNPFQAFVGFGPDASVAANGARLVHEGRQSLADHLHQFAVRQTLISSAHVHLWARRTVSAEKFSSTMLLWTKTADVLSNTPNPRLLCWHFGGSIRAGC